MTVPEDERPRPRIIPGSGELVVSGSRVTAVEGKTGYVALLDVLGFAERISVIDPEGAWLAEYLDALMRAVERSGCEYVVFSDSIVLTLEGDQPDNLLVIAQACSRLMVELLDRQLPVRGAIARGHFMRSSVGEHGKSSVFVAGRAIVDAYRYEQRQDWVGVMITPSALKARDLRSQCTLAVDGQLLANKGRLAWPLCIQHCQEIPFHSSVNLAATELQDGFAIVPGGGEADFPAMLATLRRVFDRVTWLKSIAPAPSAQRKYKTTIQWLSQIIGFWNGQEEPWKAANNSAGAAP
jgi:uncharacterized protein (DUF1330 family)